MNKPKVQSFHDFLNEYGRTDEPDHSFIRGFGRRGQRHARWVLAEYNQQVTDKYNRISEARTKYNQAIRDGLIVAPNRFEQLIAVAQGHPDNPSTKAARRLLAKKENPMKQYIRTNEEGKKVIDYDLLDIAAQINFNTDALNFAGDLKIDLSDFTAPERRAAVFDAVNAQAEFAFEVYDEEGDLVSVSPNTRQAWILAVANEFLSDIARPFINICERYGGAERCNIGDYRDLNPDGNFYETSEAIYEIVNGRNERIAEAASA